MTKILLYYSILLCASCGQADKGKEPDSRFKQVVIREANTTPTVDIPAFNLISNNLAKDRVSAYEILKVKRKWPLAMQRKDSLLFENILADNFTFRAEGEFFTRADYIHDRVHGTWTIDTVRYKNMVLQFFDNIALLTYKNSLTGTDSVGHRNIEHYSWADIYSKENGQWKILGCHLVEANIEYPAN